MRFGIRPQAVLLAGVPLVFLLVVLGLAGLISKQTEQTSYVAEVVGQSQAMLDTVNAAKRGVRQSSGAKRPVDFGALAAARGQLSTQEGKLLDQVRGRPLLTKRAEDYARALDAAFTLLTGYARAVEAGDVAGAQRILKSPAGRRADAEVNATQKALSAAVRIDTFGSPAERRKALQALERELLVGTLAGIGLTVLVSFLFGVRIVRRLGVLGQNAQRLAAGLPTVPVGGGDEISELDAIYRSMADSIASSAIAHEQTLQELERERAVTARLQQTLLPEIPAIDGVTIHTAYTTPIESAQIGGDWFDVFALSERYVGLSVGDVTGHGLRAVTAMGFVRQAIRVVARLDDDPQTIVERVNRVLCEEQASLASAFFGIYDRETGNLTYVLAGHGPPIVTSDTGELALLQGGGMLLGLDAGVRFTTYERRLAPGDTLVLYTDGIVEPERDYVKGMRDLEAAILGELAEPSANLAEGIQSRVFSQHPPRDDSALLVLRIGRLISADESADPVWHFDARDQHVARTVKREFLSALESLGPNRPDLLAAEMVYGELISNVVRHTPGSARMQLGVDDGKVVLQVDDKGPLFTTSENGARAKLPNGDLECGRGLYIIETLCERIEVEPIDGGKRTTVALPPATEPGDGHSSPSK